MAAWPCFDREGSIGKVFRRPSNEILGVLPAMLLIFLSLNVSDPADSLIYRGQRVVVARGDGTVLRLFGLGKTAAHAESTAIHGDF
jgi:hypothetical protein